MVNKIKQFLKKIFINDEKYFVKKLYEKLKIPKNIKYGKYNNSLLNLENTFYTHHLLMSNVVNKNNRIYTEKALLKAYKKFAKTKAGKAVKVLSNNEIKIQYTPIKNSITLSETEKIMMEKLIEDMKHDFDMKFLTGRYDVGMPSKSIRNDKTAS